MRPGAFVVQTPQWEPKPMPVKHLRVCPTPCNRIRYAACGNACRVPADTDPENWRINLQLGAGTIGRPIHAGIRRTVEHLDGDFLTGRITEDAS